MKKKTDMTTMWVSKTQLEQLRKLKKHPSQPDWEIIDVLLEAYDIVQAQASMQPAKGVRADG